MLRCENCGVSVQSGTRCTDCGSMARIERVVSKVAYPPWTITVRQDGPRSYLQIRDDHGVCNVTGGSKPWSGRKWMLSPHMTDTEIVKTALKAVLSAVEHETLENFKYEGVAIFDPHIRVDDLLALRAACPLDLRQG